MLSSSSTDDASDGDTDSTLCTNLSPNGNNNGDSSSPKSSSSTSSSLSRPLPFSRLIIISSTNENNPKKHKKMDDVWRDLRLGLGSSSSISSGVGGISATSPTFNNNETKLTLRLRSVPSMGVNMQEFLGTFSRESSVGNNPPPNRNGFFTLFGSSIPIDAPPSATNTPKQVYSSPAALALASSSTDPLPEEGNSVRARLPAALGGSNSRAPISRRKRRKPPNDVCARRARRMIMNRESAARSRERRRAYNSKLEREIAFLTEENERLNRQATLMRLAAAIAAHQVPEKPPFRRSSTPPF